MSWIVLSISERSPLQVTRDMIMKQAGYRVVCARTSNDALSMASIPDFDAVVLGDSVEGEERITLVRKLRSLLPGVPIITFYRVTSVRSPKGLADEEVESLAPPESVLLALRRVLGRRGKPGSAGE